MLASRITMLTGLLLTMAAAWSAATRPGPVTIDPREYQLVWSDEFTKDGPLDPQHWRFEQGFVRNEELQWYQPENATCKGGLLVFEARREKRANPNHEAGSGDWRRSRETIEYTSASANTRGLHAWLYGRFEIRAKVDTHRGSWPAIWMLGTSGGRWPANGEVDIMEYYNNTVLANLAWIAPSGRQQWNTGRTPLRNFPADFAEKFHTWRMDWDEQRLAIFLDDQQLNEQDLSKTLNRGNVTDNPFRRPMYLLLNLAIGANGGDPAGTAFPLRYEVDYVRIYQTPAQQAATKAALAAAPPASRPRPATVPAGR